MSLLVAEFALVAAMWLLLVVLTVIGAGRRGQWPPLCLASGVFFPVTWTVWYVIDDRATGGRGRTSAWTWCWSGSHKRRP